MIKEIFSEKTAKAKIQLTDKQINDFCLYYEKLIEKNKVMNLTAITQPEEVAVKHFIDSLAVYEKKFFPANGKICDIGTGAGFPGIPLKIVYNDLSVSLVDSLAKRLNFLNEVISELSLLDIVTIHSRAEDIGQNALHREKYDVVVARAVAPLKTLCEYCLPLAKQGGIFAAMKGRQSREELDDAKTALKLLKAKVIEVKEVVLPDIDDKRTIIYIKKIEKTPALFPRKAGLPEKKPL